jgi:hypothetical protein
MNLIEDYLWLTLSGGLTPLMKFIEGANSFGKKVQAFGAQYSMGMTYRTQSNLGISIGIDSWNSFYYPQGEGINGRIGDNVTDQTLQVMIKIGWVHLPDPS